MASISLKELDTKINDFKTETISSLDNINKKIGDFVNVKQFGVVGNGIVDDTMLLQSALNSGSKRLFVPRGTYMISSSLNIATNTEIVGEGNHSILKLVPDAGNIDMLLSQDTNKITIRSLKIDANKDFQSDKLAHTTCLQFHRSDDLTLDNLTVVGSLIEGVYVYSSKDITLSNILAENNGYTRQDASGIHIDSCMGGNVLNIITRNNGFHGLIVSGSQRINFNSIYTHNNGWDGVRVQYDSMYNIFKSIQSYENFRGIYFTTNSNYNQVANSIFNSNEANGLNFNLCINNMLNNVFAIDNGGVGLLTVDAGDIIYSSGLLLKGNIEGEKYLEAGSQLLSTSSIISL